MDTELRDAERLYETEPTDENRVRLRRAQERAGVIVWVAYSVDLGSCGGRESSVYGIFSTEDIALEKMTARDPRGGHPYKRIPPPRNQGISWPRQPPPGDGILLYNGWLEQSMRIRPWVLNERG